jgi:hypothetical protein
MDAIFTPTLSAEDQNTALEEASAVIVSRYWLQYQASYFLLNY